MKKNFGEDVDLNLNDDQMDHDINQATLIEQDKQLLDEMKTFNGNLTTMHSDGREIVRELNLVKGNTQVIVEYLAQALDPKPSYNLRQELQKIADDSGAIIIATKDGCMREFNENVDKKAKEFADVITRRWQRL